MTRAATSAPTWHRHVAPGLFGALVVLAGASWACAPSLQPIGGTPPAPAPVVRGEANGHLARDRQVLVALEGKAPVAPVTATGRWKIDEDGGRAGFVRGAGGERWRVEQRGASLRIAGDGDDATPWRPGPFVARPSDGDSFLRYNGKRYRGELVFTATDSGILVVNRLPVESYLRGVVPLELGTRNPLDQAALEAQAIAARSYTYIRVPASEAVVPASGWHVTASVTSQVYGGVDAEHPVVDGAVQATEGLVLRFGGLLVDAPYFSSCGGKTAGPKEAWRDAKEEPYLHPEDDTDPRTGKPYCDLSSRNSWTQEFDAGLLTEAARRALQANGSRDPRPVTVTGVRIPERTPSGRAAALVIATDRGDIAVSARDIRYVLRDARGAMLPSTYFSVERETRSRGALTGLTLRGVGNGHGVGMCQWGAIGRARAGADARTILRHYYPGTVVGFAD
ncbi:MAG: SpoIID/LytB domain-containing protein [Gemmatimonadaceae bacterium]|nr:SpoIID/LytB domain-containing protein [Gemmatimonadaceae bacterium]